MAALHVMLAETVDFLSKVLSRSQLQVLLRKEIRRLGGDSRATTDVRALKKVKQRHARRVAITGVVHDWFRDSDYTDEQGEPLPLTLDKLRELISKRFPAHQIASIVRFLVDHGLVKKTTRGLLVLTTERQVVFAKYERRAIAIERAAVLMPQFLRVTLLNADTNNPDAREFNRDARVFSLPEKYVPLWRAVARERAQAFIEGIDNWLEDHSAADSAGRVREVAMNCFAYTGNSRQLGSSTRE